MMGGGEGEGGGAETMARLAGYKLLSKCVVNGQMAENYFPLSLTLNFS